MNRCTHAIAKDCSDADLRPVLLYLRHTPRLVCKPCRDYMTANGIAFTETEPAPVRPAWIANLRGRDETGALVA